MRTFPLASPAPAGCGVTALAVAGCGVTAPAVAGCGVTAPAVAGCGVTAPGSRNPAAGSSVAMVIRGWPTATTAPGAAWILATAPAKGTGTSTAAFAVSTSTIG